MVPLDEARRLVLDACPARAPVRVPTADALGCVVAEAVVAAEAVPPFANSAVDGYAVRVADVATVPVELPVGATVAAGDAGDRPLAPGLAIRVMTGAPLPPGTEAVVMVEDTDRLGGGERVRISATVPAGAAVRDAGSDVAIGDEVLPAGTVVRPAHLGVLASIGAADIAVVPRQRVGVLSTGDELVEAGRPLGPGQIRESNKPMLLALVAQANAIPVDLGIAPDDEDALVAALENAGTTCDAVITSGGVSMGDFDVVKLVLDRVGKMHWLQIAIKPAKPFAFGLLASGTPLFGLPGNPVSSMVSFELLARPALRQMMGHTAIDRPRVAAIADEALGRRPDGKTHFVRVRTRFAADGRIHVTSTGGQGSHQLAATAGADGLAVVADGDGVNKGGEVEVLLLQS
jgi:molybdenum cofactor synthesis domain-containing protein